VAVTDRRYCRRCVCRVCVLHAFYAFCAFHALVESVSCGNMEGSKVQVPPPAYPFISCRLLICAPISLTFFSTSENINDVTPLRYAFWRYAFLLTNLIRRSIQAASFHPHQLLRA